jgi:hypothetical protein
VGKGVVMDKQLYVLHTPRTGGNFIKQAVTPVLDANSLSYYIKDQYTPHNVDFSEQVFLAGHWGTYPITVRPNIDVVSVIRNPVEVRASLFVYFYDRAFGIRADYSKFSSLTDKFKYYVFDDTNFEIHRNMQARFICNSADPVIFDPSLYAEQKYSLQAIKDMKTSKAFSWFVGNENTSLENAMSNLSSFYSVHKYDNLNLTCQDISTWFNQNYNVDIEFNMSNLVNEGASTLPSGPSSTEQILEGLSSDEIERIESFDSIDKAIYNQVV